MQRSRPKTTTAFASAAAMLALSLHGGRERTGTPRFCCCSGFVPSLQQQHRPASPPRIRLGGTLPREGGNDGGEGEGIFDVDDARNRLEALFGDDDGLAAGRDDDEDNDVSPSSSSSLSSSSRRPLIPESWEDQLDSTPPPLTSIGRERRLAEMSLLRSLDADDAAMSDLWALWFSERGPKAASELLAAEELAGRRRRKRGERLREEGIYDGDDDNKKEEKEEEDRRHDEAERRLRNLIDEHGIHWAEPLNRLATLLYRRGRLDESRALCQLVLAVKPWHFGALSGMVLVCAGMGDKAGARLWADRRLPPMQPIGNNSRRREWVNRVAREALRELGRAEEMVLESFGERDDHPLRYGGGGAARGEADRFDRGRSGGIDSGEEGAWQ